MNAMGKVIGRATGWDQPDHFTMLIYDLKVNEIGRRFVPDFTGGDLEVNWETGEASTYDAEGNQTLLRTDWSVFNRETAAPGWQVNQEVR